MAYHFVYSLMLCAVLLGLGWFFFLIWFKLLEVKEYIRWYSTQFLIQCFTYSMAPYIPQSSFCKYILFISRKPKKSIDCSGYSITTPGNTEPYIEGSELISFVFRWHNIIWVQIQIIFWNIKIGVFRDKRAQMELCAEQVKE